MSQPAIGIDLGTTYSALAAINPSGHPEIVPNREGERIIASAVFFNEDGTVHVGQLARSAAAGEPSRVITEVKREMGQPDKSLRVGEKTYSPVEISALILKRIREDGELVLGPLKHAVITVPAYFDEVRRKATMDAASAAGLDVLRIINEPTAAALAYAAGGHVKGKVLVYDLGGGTFDVSVVDIASAQEVRVLASEGDHQLGGKDLDRSLAKHLSELFEAEHGVSMLGDPQTEFRVMETAEDAKKKLSFLPMVSNIPLHRDGIFMLASVKRETYESLINEYIVRTEMLVEDALAAAELKASNIDTVLLVGGASRTPAVQQMLQRKFGKDPVAGVNPDEAVALGAAIQAGAIMQQRGMISLAGAAGEALERTRIKDVSPHSYGTISLSDAYGRIQPRNVIIIPKNTPLPCSRTQSFHTAAPNQQMIKCNVTQGEDPDPEFVKKVYEANLDLPPNRPAHREIQITFRYDDNGRMSCKFLDVESGRTKEVDLDMATEQSSTKPKNEFDDNDFQDIIIE